MRGRAMSAQRQNCGTKRTRREDERAVKEYFLETYGLEKTVDLLFHVLDSIPVSVFIKNEKLETIFSNKANQELLERSAEETIGLTDLQIHSPENAAFFTAQDTKS